MENKCEWKDGKFYPCLNIGGLLEQRNDHVGFYGKDGGFYGRGIANYCPSCGADIRKPEQEVIIKPDGGTWVARYDGVDYFCLQQSNMNGMKNTNIIEPAELVFLAGGIKTIDGLLMVNTIQRSRDKKEG